jgi:hypothetical protein
MNARQKSVRRPFAEWGLYLSVCVCLATTALFIASTRFNWASPSLELVQDFLDGGVYTQVQRGDLWFFGYPATDATGFIPPDLAKIPAEPRGPLAQGQQPWRRRSLTLPGFAVHTVFYPMLNIYLRWSVKVSLALPATVSLLAAALLLYRLRKDISRADRAGPECCPG